MSPLPDVIIVALAHLVGFFSPSVWGICPGVVLAVGEQDVSR